MTTIHAARSRTVALVLAVMTAAALFAVVLLGLARPAHAADYPPPVPPTSTTCSVNSTSGIGGQGTKCNVNPINTTKPAPPSSTHTSSSNNDLASTGFATATALVVVVALVGVGGVFLYAGRRRHG